ncbi:MAG: peptide chain release factor N(5)-glutamine methyltransferase [Candidatus Brocadiaceae bacterium]|uniref:peptide chain release factor N(5)-glutamine methyltransferase n=1 Tax=Candidatus Wunengus sp. YC61 TaxID=3367698 RepID=UPI002717BF98|nr:peptide chain release factor N(5)-glutamine methyltransferase [Candidatus Brocadiaceae bacterium]
MKNTFPDKYTISSLFQWASKILQVHGIDSPSLDAEVLLSNLLSCKRIDLYIHPDQPVEETVAMRYKESIQRRSQRLPLQYITNHAEFMSLDFYVDERVLIPRPETELLVEAVIKRAQILTHEIVIVDIGVGSGNIAITLAKKIDKARIFAIDISPDALAVAKINAQRHHVLDKITFLCGNIFQPLEGFGIESKVNFIVSNPPYVSSSEFNNLQKEVRDFEPYTALISGQDGLQMFKRIIANANTWLKPGGFITFEVGEKQARKVARLFAETRCFKKADLLKDYQHISRIVIAQMEEGRG